MSLALTHPVSLSIKRNLALLHVPTDASILIGVSGGVDSMVLLYVLHKLGYAVSAAHVNFNLRGTESHNDALFVKQWCQEQGISHYELSQDTKAYIATNDTNVQTAARSIRYEWWEFLVHTHQFDFVATAHQLDDAIETVFLNLLRGTGLKGLRGIPHRRDFYIRPMLDCSRKEIEAFALHFGIPYRTDSSNLADDYQRNRIRHQLMPVLEDLAPGFHASIKHSLHRINSEWEAWDSSFQNWIDHHIRFQSDGFTIECHSSEFPFLLRWLEEKGIPWNLSADFVNADKPSTGQVLNYENYRLSRTAQGYYLEEIQPAIDLVLHKPGHYAFGNFSLHIEMVSGDQFLTSPDPYAEFVSSDVIRWPLHIRHVRDGDSFQPIGMSGKTKKIQDLMVDLKLEMFEKERLLLLTNADHILWVIGIRLDERAKVKSGEEEIYSLKYLPAEKT